MSREELLQRVIGAYASSLVIEAGTGVGKTRLALEKAKLWGGKVLVIVPRKVLEREWREEARKWKFPQGKLYTMCYASMKEGEPMVKDDWDVVIFDECHHLTERCREYLPWSRHYIFLTATLTREVGWWIQSHILDFEHIQMSTRESIDNEILPEPKVYLYPLRFHTYMEKIDWRWKTYDANERSMYQFIEQQIKNSEWDKEKKKLLLIERLKWLANRKLPIVKDMVSRLHGRRLLVFCNTIEQSLNVDCLSINSKGTNPQKALEMFNDHQVERISACNMLDEGVNLKDCEIAIFASVNSSARIQAQRIGRMLRHPKPKIIIPYYEESREADIVKKLVKENFKLVEKRVYDIKHEEVEGNHDR